MGQVSIASTTLPLLQATEVLLPAYGVLQTSANEDDSETPPEKEDKGSCKEEDTALEADRMTSEQLDLLFKSLTRHYDLVLDRRKTLSGQASSLMTFAAIIQTILVGLLTTLATNENARKLLSTNPNYPSIQWGISMGFAMYLGTALLGIFSYAEAPWTPAPIVVEGKTPEDWNARLEEIHKKPENLAIIGLEMQLITAIDRHQRTNNRKYLLLLAGYIVLIAGILFTAVTGYLILGGIVVQ